MASTFVESNLLSSDNSSEIKNSFVSSSSGKESTQEEPTLEKNLSTTIYDSILNQIDKPIRFVEYFYFHNSKDELVPLEQIENEIVFGIGFLKCINNPKSPRKEKKKK